VLYGAGGHRWAMTERGKGRTSRTQTKFRVGPSAIAWDGHRLVIDVDEITAPLPSRIRGRITLDAESVNDRMFAIDAAHQHQWWPIAPASRITVDLDRPNLRWNGSGYLDCNFGSVPLEDTFAHWDWSRTVEADGSTVLYDVTEKTGATSSLALRFPRLGAVHTIDAPPRANLKKTFWRLARTTPSAATHRPRLIKTLEDGPFYARSLIETQVTDTPVVAIHEHVSLDRFGKRWVQALLPVKMPRRRG
jgi:carotenoid 1,2-hydratase